MNTTSNRLLFLFLGSVIAAVLLWSRVGPLGEVPVAHAAPLGYCGGATTTDCVQSLKNATGTAISTTTLRVEPDLTGSQLQIQVRGVDGSGNTSDGQGVPYLDLAAFGFSTNDTLTIEILLNTYQPKGLTGAANFQNWSYSTSTKLLSIVAKPIAASYGLPFDTACTAQACANQASIDLQALLFVNAEDFSDLPAQFASFANQVSGGYIGSNAQFFSPPEMEVTDNTYEFNVGAPHFKTDGTTVNTGFFKVFVPDALLQGMWNVTDTSDLVFDLKFTVTGGGVSTTTATATAVQGGVIIQSQGFSYSVNQINMDPAQQQAQNVPGVSAVGMGILAGLLALAFVWVVYRRRRPASSSEES